MATSKTAATEAAKTIKTAEKTASKQKESTYTAEEFSANAVKLFGTRKECVSAALKAAGITTCTLSKARDVVEKFIKKEVK